MNNIGIIGAGNMGEALIKGLNKSKQFCVSVFEKDKKRMAQIAKLYRVEKNTLEQLTKRCEIIIICVKPQDIDELILRIKRQISSRHLLISIAAGVTTLHIEKNLGKKIAVVRVMPNLPGLIGNGLSAYCLGKSASNRHAKYTEMIFKTMGKVFKAKEDRMDAITAISGSGPGFVAYFTAALEEAALDIGLNRKQARLLAVSATAGTGSMLEAGVESPQEIVRRVASKGGTTEAGIKELEKAKIKATVKKVAKAAKKRARELSSPR